MLNFFNVEFNFSEEQKKKLLETSDKIGFDNFRDPSDNRKIFLETCVLSPCKAKIFDVEFINEVFQAEFTFMCFGRLKSNVQLVPHTDFQYHSENRNSSIIFPLAPDYSNYIPMIVHPNSEEQIYVPHHCGYAFDPQVVHSVPNNEHVRIGFQYGFKQSLDELYKLHQAGKLLA